MRPKLSTAQRERESREGQWTRYILWYEKWVGGGTTYKTFYERSQVDEFLEGNPEYVARRLDENVKTVIWNSGERN